MSDITGFNRFRREKIKKELPKELGGSVGENDENSEEMKEVGENDENSEDMVSAKPKKKAQAADV